jgi:hypothetical protein
MTTTSINNAGLVVSVENGVTAAANFVDIQPNFLVVNVASSPV